MLAMTDKVILLDKFHQGGTTITDYGRIIKVPMLHMKRILFCRIVGGSSWASSAEWVAITIDYIIGINNI